MVGNYKDIFTRDKANFMAACWTYVYIKEIVDKDTSVLRKKEDVLLRHEIFLKVICEKFKFSTVIFAIIVVTMNGHTYI